MKSLTVILFCLSIHLLYGQIGNKCKLIGRIYCLESRQAFFQFISKDSANYYSIGDVGFNEIQKSPAIWEKTNDSTISLKVIYRPNYFGAEFILKYNKEKDYWQDEELIFVFRRRNTMTYDNFSLSEIPSTKNKCRRKNKK